VRVGGALRSVFSLEVGLPSQMWIRYLRCESVVSDANPLSSTGPYCLRCKSGILDVLGGG